MADDSSLIDKELVARAQTGDKEAFEELVRRYYPNFYTHYCLSRIPKPDAKDLAQDAFLRIQRGLRYFRRESSFKTWARRIACNVEKTYWQQKRRRQEVLESDLEGKQGDLKEARSIQRQVEQSPFSHNPRRPDDAAAACELAEAVHEGLSDLPEDERKVLILEIEEFTVEEIAEILECSRITVWRLKRGAKRRMREQLERFR